MKIYSLRIRIKGGCKTDIKIVYNKFMENMKYKRHLK